jgi:hypothetical protein
MTGLFFWLGNLGWAGIAALAAISFGFAVWVRMKVKSPVEVK